LLHLSTFYLFFFTDTATTAIYTLSLHDALPIFRIIPEKLRVEDPDHARARTRWCNDVLAVFKDRDEAFRKISRLAAEPAVECRRSEEHTSELQSRRDLVCRLLLEKKKKIKILVI